MKCVHVCDTPWRKEKVTYECECDHCAISYHLNQCRISESMGMKPRNYCLKEWAETGSDNPEMKWVKTESIEAWTDAKEGELDCVLSLSIYASDEEYHHIQFAGKCHHN